jgi:hypothetical protein
MPYHLFVSSSIVPSNNPSTGAISFTTFGDGFGAQDYSSRVNMIASRLLAYYLGSSLSAIHQHRFAEVIQLQRQRFGIQKRRLLLEHHLVSEQHIPFLSQRRRWSELLQRQVHTVLEMEICCELMLYKHY